MIHLFTETATGKSIWKLYLLIRKSFSQLPTSLRKKKARFAQDTLATRPLRVVFAPRKNVLSRSERRLCNRRRAYWGPGQHDDRTSHGVAVSWRPGKTDARPGPATCPTACAASFYPSRARPMPPFLEEVRRHGFTGLELTHNFPQLRRSANEVTQTLRRLRPDMLTCSGYKPDLLGGSRPGVSAFRSWPCVMAGRRATWKVRVNETFRSLDPALDGRRRLCVAGPGGQGPQGRRIGREGPRDPQCRRRRGFRAAGRKLS